MSQAHQAYRGQPRASEQIEHVESLDSFLITLKIGANVGEAATGPLVSSESNRGAPGFAIERR